VLLLLCKCTVQKTCVSFCKRHTCFNVSDDFSIRVLCLHVCYVTSDLHSVTIHSSVHTSCFCACHLRHASRVCLCMQYKS
jgi:hypothetical protein